MLHYGDLYVYMQPSGQQAVIHPVSLVLSEIVAFSKEIGYTIALGPEKEDEYYNFDALNIPASHPAREMQDTFWIRGEEGKVLRTHTSPMQIRYLETHTPPIRIMVPGKVFRNEATDATHETQFHQVEGLCVTENATLAELKGVLEALLHRMFGESVELRYRPSYFPFTEPSLEVDIRRQGSDQWIEVLGCGMVHRHILSRTGCDPRRYQGFAFGIGIDRIALLRYGIDDVRALYSGDIRLVNQFHYETSR